MSVAATRQLPATKIIVIGTTTWQGPPAAELPLGRVAAHNLGADGDRAVSAPLVYLMRWKAVAAEIQSPTTRDFALYWGESERTAFRLQRVFRTAFPGHLTPDVLLHLIASRRSRSPGWRGLASTLVPIRWEGAGTPGHA